jgi:putative transposase
VLLITDLNPWIFYLRFVPTRLERRYDTDSSHFITCSCYQRRPLLDDDRVKNIFLTILEETRLGYDFSVFGYVLMPEHFHLLISKPEKKDVGTVLQVLKQRVSHAARKILDPTLSQTKGKDGAPISWGCIESHPFASQNDGAPTEIDWDDLKNRPPWQFWQRRFYDFSVWSRTKHIEKLKYIHRNPVVRGLVARPEDWPWSSFRHYAMGEIGLVEIESDWTALRREREVHVMEISVH